MMSQTADNDKVARDNERLFSIYENNFKSSNVKEYTETAAKLTVWLGDSKAYYTAARPMIVRLLIIAQMTLRGAVGYPLDISVPFMPVRWLHHPLTASYVMLIQAVRPFEGLFVETPLKHVVTHLLQAVEGIPLSPVSPPLTSHQASPPFPTPTSLTDHHLKEISTREQKSRPTSPQCSQIIQVHYLNPGDAPAPQVSDQPSIESRHSTANAEQALPSASDLPNLAKSQRNASHEITFVGMYHKPASGPRSVTSTTPLQGAQGSIGAPRQGLNTKKPKKIDLSAFVQSDIQDFKERQAQAQRGASDSVLIKNEPVVEEKNSLKAARQSADGEGIKSVTPQHATPSVAQMQRPPSHNQLRQGHAQLVPQPDPGLINQLASHNFGHFESSSHFTTSQTLGQQQSNSVHASPIADFQPMPSLPFHNGSRATDKVQNISTGIPAPPTPLPSHPTQLTTNPQLAPPPYSVSTLADHLADSPTIVAPTAKQPTGGSPATSIAPGAVAGVPQFVASVEVQIPPRTQTMRPLLISEDSNLARFFKLYEKFTSAKPQLKVEGNTEVGERSETRETMYSAGDMAALLLGEETPKKQFQVVAFTRGGTQDSFTEIAFDLAQSDLDYLSKWLNKKESRVKDTASSYCLSLGCYSSHELMKRLGKQLDANIEVRLTEAIASMPSVWPQIGGLSMNVSFDGSRKGLPLAPPLVTTADGYVDLSEFALLGRNSLSIHQEEKDFSDYTFVLHAHNPTLGQLQEIVRQRKNEIEWKDWLVGVTRPLHIDVPSLSPAPF